MFYLLYKHQWNPRPLNQTYTTNFDIINHDCYLIGSKYWFWIFAGCVTESSGKKWFLCVLKFSFLSRSSLAASAQISLFQLQRRYFHVIIRKAFMKPAVSTQRLFFKDSFSMTIFIFHSKSLFPWHQHYCVAYLSLFKLYFISPRPSAASYVSVLSTLNIWFYVSSLTRDMTSSAR